MEPAERVEGLEKVRRYYSGVCGCRTTICCSSTLVLLLSLAGLVAPAAAQLSLFPAQASWTIALNNQLVAPPSYSGSRGYFAIHGDRVVAYTLAAGALEWSAKVGTQSPPAVGDGRVFVAAADNLVALSDKDGTEVWRRPLTDPVAVPLVIRSGWLVAATVKG